MERDFYLSKDLFYCMCKWALGFHNGSAATLTVRMRLHFLVMTTTVAPPPAPPHPRASVISASACLLCTGGLYFPQTEWRSKAQAINGID